jgi:hypothetical protein
MTLLRFLQSYLKPYMGNLQRIITSGPNLFDLTYTQDGSFNTRTFLTENSV